MTLVLAHAGHWYTAAVFFGPVVLLPLGLWVTTLVGGGTEHPPAD